MDILLDTLQFGIPYAILALGVFISYRILDFADLSCEGTFVFGAAISIVMIANGINPWIATIGAILGGCLAGFITGILHTKLKINGLLSGIITMTGLFSINLVIFGINKGEPFSLTDTFNSFRTLKISLDTGDPTIFGLFGSLFDVRKYGLILELVIIAVIIVGVLYLFFGTEVGMSMRACGMNQKMARAQGINTTFYIILGLVISNALIALSGSLCAQRDYTCSSTSGTGMIVVGLASIIIGEALFGKRSFLNWIISVALGAIVYYFIISIVLFLGFPSHLLKLLYAVLIVIILVEPIVVQKIKTWYNSPKCVRKREAKAKLKEDKLEEKIANFTEEEKIAYDNKQKLKAERLELKKTKTLEKEEKYNKSLEKKRQAIQLKLKEKYEKNSYKENEKVRKQEEKFKNNPKLKEKYDLKQAKIQKSIDERNAYIKENGILHVSNVVKKFNPTGNPLDLKIALNGIDVKIKEGEFVTIIGGNGSGKSTFFNTVSGVYIPEDGNIFINSMDVTKLPEYKRAFYIGRVAQDPYQGTAHNMSILENMSIAMRRNKKKSLRWGFNVANTELFTKQIEELELGLENRMTSKIGTLSGGQRQAVTLLMATLQRPDVLFLDEHTAALDPKTAKTVLELTDKIVKENNLTAVMVTHNMKDAIKYGNRLLMFNNGKIIYDVSGPEKENLTVEELLRKFENKVEFSDKDILG